MNDQSIIARSFEADVLRGLAASPKVLPCKYFYDEKGSLLFDEICEQSEYYLTRAEADLLTTHVDTLIDAMGPHATLIEFGSGSSLKTRLVLDRATTLDRYLPIDISARYLEEIASALRLRYPRLEILPQVFDYTKPIPSLENLASPRGRRVVFFPGSSIGNFEPHEIVGFLQGAARVAGKDGIIIIGVDIPKDKKKIELAYDDPAGVTARFNRNLLVRINRELGGDFDVAHFAHRAEWQAEHQRVEMQLVCDRAQRVTVSGKKFELAAHEAIVTEHCYKWSPERFCALTESAGLKSERVLFDPRGLVSMHILSVAS